MFFFFFFSLVGYAKWDGFTLNLDSWSWNGNKSWFALGSWIARWREMNHLFIHTIFQTQENHGPTWIMRHFHYHAKTPNLALPKPMEVDTTPIFSISFTAYPFNSQYCRILQGQFATWHLAVKSQNPCFPGSGTRWSCRKRAIIISRTVSAMLRRVRSMAGKVVVTGGGSSQVSRIWFPEIGVPPNHPF